MRAWIAKSLLLISAVYYTGRVIMFILSVGFDFVLFSKKLQMNLWAAAWIFDVCIGFIALFTVMLYLKNRILSFVLMLVTAGSFIIFIPATGLTERFESIDTLDLQENYAMSTDYFYLKHNTYHVRARLYKEVFPFVYTLIDSNREEISKIEEQDILQSFTDKNYEVTTDGSSIYIENLKLSLE